LTHWRLLQPAGGHTAGENLSRNYGGTFIKRVGFVWGGRGNRERGPRALLPAELVMSTCRTINSVVFFAVNTIPLIAERHSVTMTIFVALVAAAGDGERTKKIHRSAAFFFLRSA